MTTQWLFKTPIAHRGLHGAGIPENSMAAFLNAAQKEYPSELDVRISRDGEIVVFHDGNLERMTGKKGAVDDYTFRFIRSLRLGGTNEKIPSFSGVLKAMENKSPLLIEIKNESETDRRIEDGVLALLSNYNGDFALQSFNPWSIKYCKEKRPDFFCGLLSDGFTPSMSDEKIKLIKSLVFESRSILDFVSYNAALIPDSFTASLSPDMPLIGWTVRSRDAWIIAKTKVKNIIFENFIPAE